MSDAQVGTVITALVSQIERIGAKKDATAEEVQALAAATAALNAFIR